MNVIVVSDHAAINGGQAKVAIDAAIGLARAGVPVSFFAAAGPVDPRLAEQGVEVVCLGQHDILSDPNRVRAAVSGVWNATAADALSALLARKASEPTVVHWHGFAKALSPALAPVLRRARVPVIYTMHEYFLSCPNGGFYDYQKEAICTRVPGHLSCVLTNCDSRNPAHKVWRLWRHVVAHRVAKLPAALDYLIYISDTQRAAVEQFTGSVPLRHVPNPVSIEQLPPVKVESNDCFLFIGRLAPEKGSTWFARAAKQAGVKAVFVGDGPERDSIRDANPEALVTGWLPPVEVAAWLDRARCLVFPSLWYECQPLVPLEAVARGVPVIAGKWSAGAETVRNYCGGLEVRTADDHELIAALAHLQVPENAAAFGASGYRNYWASPLTIERHVSTLLSLYSDALSDS